MSHWHIPFIDGTKTPTRLCVAMKIFGYRCIIDDQLSHNTNNNLSHSLNSHKGLVVLGCVTAALFGARHELDQIGLDIGLFACCVNAKIVFCYGWGSSKTGVRLDFRFFFFCLSIHRAVFSGVHSTMVLPSVANDIAWPVVRWAILLGSIRITIRWCWWGCQ